MAHPSRRRRSLIMAVSGLVGMLAGLLLLAMPAGAHFAAVDDGTSLVCEGEQLVLRASAVSWVDSDTSGEHPRVVIEMRTDVSDWTIVTVGAFTAETGYRVTGSAVVPAGATIVDVRVYADPAFAWGDDFSAATPSSERRITVPEGIEDCTDVVLPPEPTPTPTPALVPVAVISCVSDTDGPALVSLTTGATDTQTVDVFVDGVLEGSLDVSAASPATLEIDQEPAVTNTVTVEHDGTLIASADVQCVEGVILPPEPPTPTPETPTPGPTPTPTPVIFAPTPTPGGPELPRTGSQSQDMTNVALVLVLGGSVMLAGSWFLRTRTD